MDDLVVCCETPMIRLDDVDYFGQAYYYYRCLQCGACTDEAWSEEEDWRSARSSCAARVAGVAEGTK